MRAARRFGMMILGLAGCLLTGAARADTIAFDFTGGGNHTFGGASFTAGYTFTVNTPIEVTQLGVWDPKAGTALTRDHAVGIWDQSGTLLGSATVLTTSPMSGGFQYVSVTPFELDPGQTYTIGAFYPDTGVDAGTDQPLRSSATGFTQASEVTFGTEREIFNNAGLTNPTENIFGTSIDPANFGPNFQFVPLAAAVPEPSSLALLALGVTGLAGWRRWRKRTATA